MNLQTTIQTIEAAVQTAAQTPSRHPAQPVGGVPGATIRTDSYTGPKGSGFAVVAQFAGVARVRNIGPETGREKPWPTDWKPAILSALSAFWNALDTAQKTALADAFATIRVLRDAGEFGALLGKVRALAATEELTLAEPQQALKATVLTLVS